VPGVSRRHHSRCRSAHPGLVWRHRGGSGPGHRLLRGQAGRQQVDVRDPRRQRHVDDRHLRRDLSGIGGRPRNEHGEPHCRQIRRRLRLEAQVARQRGPAPEAVGLQHARRIPPLGDAARARGPQPRADALHPHHEALLVRARQPLRPGDWPLQGPDRGHRPALLRLSRRDDARRFRSELRNVRGWLGARRRWAQVREHRQPLDDGHRRRRHGPALRVRSRPGGSRGAAASAPGLDGPGHQVRADEQPLGFVVRRPEGLHEVRPA
jgi:hypothetical protein